MEKTIKILNELVSKNIIKSYAMAKVMTQKEKKEYFVQAEKIAEKIFRSKKQQRKLLAK